MRISNYQPKAQKLSEKPEKGQKTFRYKKRDTSELRKTLKKHGKNIIKSLVNVNKDGTFAPATTQTFTDRLTRKGIKTEKIFSKKDSKKLVRFENACYICTPQNAQVH